MVKTVKTVDSADLPGMSGNVIKSQLLLFWENTPEESLHYSGVLAARAGMSQDVAER